MFSKPSAFLSELDSHGIYNTKMLDECSFDTECIPCSPLAEQQRRMNERGLSGWTEGDDDDWTFTGWSAAAALARKYLGNEPGAIFQGRGSSFRANLAALEEAGH